MLVCLGSQLQNDPHANLDQTEPVTVASMQNTIPSCAAAYAFASSSKFFVFKYLKLKIVDNKKAITVNQAVGTWKKIIFAFSSKPGINGNSYQKLGFSTIGKAIPATDTKTKSRYKKIFHNIN